MLLSTNPPPTPPPESNPGQNAAALIEKLAKPIPSDTGYTEVRFAHQLRRPMVMQGRLDYGGADKLGKRVDSPYTEITEIADGHVTVQREGRSKREFALDRAPQLQALLTGFSAMLGGDPAALTKLFTVSLTGTTQQWSLTLTPLQSSLARHLHAIVVDGSASEPKCFSLLETDGDASVMLLGPLAATKLQTPPTRAGLSAICHGKS
ncbi:MAG TPA: LolA-related protein [Rudaea sp.]|nr:LolA-related protein [Rudaea sp.]